MAIQKIYFATNRNPLPGDVEPPTSFDDKIGPVSGANLRFGYAEVNVKCLKNDEVEINSVTVESENITPGKDAPIYGSQKIFEEIRQTMVDPPEPRGTIIGFVHGFNNGWEDSVRRAAVLSELYANLDDSKKPVIFMFSWPSTGANILGIPIPYQAYEDDRNGVAHSGLAGARTLFTLRRFVRTLIDAGRKQKTPNPRELLCDAKFHLIVHSMGHQVMSEVLKFLPQMTDSSLGRVFDEVILAAADEHSTALDTRIAGDPAETGSLFPLTELARRITVYTNDDDWILRFLSEETKENGPRLGAEGPSVYPYPAKVSRVDCTQVVPLARDIQQHQYYRRIPEVIDDIIQVLSGKPHDEIQPRKTVAHQHYRLTKTTDTLPAETEPSEPLPGER